MNQITILKNGEPFAKTIPPFCEEDTLAVNTLITHLQSGRWSVSNGVLQIINPDMSDDLLADTLNFFGKVDRVQYVLAHLSTIKPLPSQDTWTFVEEPFAS